MNGIVQLIKYFQSEDPEKQLKMPEFQDFWFSLTLEDKKYYRTVDLATGLVPTE